MLVQSNFHRSVTPPELSELAKLVENHMVNTDSQLLLLLFLDKVTMLVTKKCLVGFAYS